MKGNIPRRTNAGARIIESVDMCSDITKVLGAGRGVASECSPERPLVPLASINNEGERI